MLMVVRVELHSLHVVVGVGETYVVFLGTVGQRQVVSLVYTGTEDICPLVVVNRCECTLCTVKVSNHFAGIVFSTPRIKSFTVRCNNGIAVAIYTCLAETC